MCSIAGFLALSATDKKLAKQNRLCLTRRVIVKIIEADFTDGDTARVPRFGGDERYFFVSAIGGVVRMNAGGKPNASGSASANARTS